ncbi:MAG: peptide/nickel transport system permease protein [Bradymonadia bacterium]|jgi:peptide/nickel transport system permease protein
MSAPPSTEYREYASYWSIVWEQFQKNRLSYVALWAIGLLFFIAVCAPIGASSYPFVWDDGTGLSFPWFRALLFNRNLFASSIDIFFNLVLVLSPLLFGTWFVLRRKTASMRPAAAAQVKLKAIGGWAVFILVSFAILMLMDEPKLAVPQFRTLALSNPDIFSIFPPIRIHYSDTLQRVSGPGTFNLLGVDGASRDIFVRLIYGTRVSLSVGVIAVSIYITIGTILGSIAGYFGGLVDIGIQRLIEIFLCFPTFFLILTLIGFLPQPSIIYVMLFIGLLGWTSSARLVRGEFLRLKNVDFVAAARAQGLGNRRIIFRHILPNAIGPVLVNATFGVASSVLIESTLAFLGFGDPTLPSWGDLLQFGRATGSTTMMLIAGAAIFITVSVFNLAGEGIRDALDPKLRK